MVGQLQPLYWRSLHGVGTHTLTYYYLDSNGCDKTG